MPFTPIPPQNVVIDQALLERCLRSAILDVCGELDDDELEATVESLDDIAYECLDRYLGMMRLSPKDIN